jgi:SAM-dependent methyltransferase
MRYFSVGHRLPRIIAKRLFGDRERWGLEVQPDDPCWKEWEKTYLDFYVANQRQSVGNTVNHAGYTVMGKVDLQGKRVLEIGPGQIAHIQYWNPATDKSQVSYVLADIQSEMLDRSSEVLRENGVPFETIAVQRHGRLPFEDNSFDMVVSFYTLEHLYPFRQFLDEFRRVLKPKGQFVGSIPSEGGLAWGCGRFLTSRRWLFRNTSIDPDKIICWEHPNFAEKILSQLDAVFEKEELIYWPLKVPSIDLNLILSFIYSNPIAVDGASTQA